MTISQSLNISQQKLNNLESSNLIATRLLAHILHQPVTFIHAHPEFELDDNQVVVFEKLVDRAATNEPLAYLLGYADFFAHRFEVNQHTLIPRPETEQLVELALKYIQNLQLQTGNLQLIDVGTGSGCITISLALALPQATIYATDVSVEALKVAKANATRLSVTNVVFLTGSLLEPLQGRTEPKSMDIIVANLPYISDSEFQQLPANVRDFEPELALRSGSDPDVLNRQLVEQAQTWLKPGGLLAYETTNGQIVRI